MKPCETCEYRTTKKTKYGTYSWCKACGCATSSPKCDCKKQKEEKEMKYSISYEIDRYEVHLIVKDSGSDLGGNNFFYCEEDAVAFALNYVKEHPDWTFKIFRREKAIIEVE